MKFMLVICSVLLSGCTVPLFTFIPEEAASEASTPSSEEASNPSTNPSNPTLHNLVAYGADDENLGNVLSGSMAGLTLINNLGYIYSIYWNGAYVKSMLYFLSTDCSGVGYVVSGGSLLSSKSIIVDYSGTVRVPAQDSSGVTVLESLVTKSRRDPTSGVCTASNISQNSAIEMTEVTHNFVDIQSTIVAPIEVVEE